MDRIEAWRLYEAAERRIEACKAANDRTGLAIAESQAARYLAEWVDAEGLTATESPASERPAVGLRTATAAVRAF